MGQLIEKLDPEKSGEISFEKFYAGFSSLDGGEDDDDDDDEGSAQLLGADIKMDVVKAKYEERSKGFEAGLGAQEEEEDDDNSSARNARFQKILNWMRSEEQRVGVTEICQTMQYLLRV